MSHLKQQDLQERNGGTYQSTIPLRGGNGGRQLEYNNNNQTNELQNNKENNGRITNHNNIQPNYDFDSNYERQQLIEMNKVLANRVDQLEAEIKQQQEINFNLLEKLNISQEQLSKTKDQQRKANGITDWKSNEVEQLNNRYHEIAQGHNQFLDNARSHSLTVQRELEYKDEEIRRLKNLLEQGSEKLTIVSVSQEKNVDKCVQLTKTVNEKEVENIKLLEQLRQKSHELDMSRLSHKAEGTFMVEVEHLRADVARLLLMLKNTQEYKDFSDISDDSSHSIRFLKDIKARTYVDNKCNKNCKLIRPCQCPSTGENQWVEDEKLLWVPEEAFKFAHELRLQYNGELTDTLIEKLLFELNKIWSKREQRLLKRVKGNAAHETAGLRRQLAFNPKYDEHQAKATIERLQRELKQSYKENRELFAQRERRNPVGVSYIGETLRMTKSVAKAKKEQESKNNLLKNKIQSMEINKYGDQSEKTLFLEGATWMSGQILKEFEALEQDIHQQSQVFTEKQLSVLHNSELTNSFGSAETAALLRKTDWHTENINNQLDNFRFKVTQLNNMSQNEMVQASLAAKTAQNPQSAIIDTF